MPLKSNVALLDEAADGDRRRGPSRRGVARPTSETNLRRLFVFLWLLDPLEVIPATAEEGIREIEPDCKGVDEPFIVLETARIRDVP